MKSGEKENYKYLGILEADTIERIEMEKKKERKVYLTRTRKLLGTKLWSRYLIKGINNKAVPFLRYSGRKKKEEDSPVLRVSYMYHHKGQRKTFKENKEKLITTTS